MRLLIDMNLSPRWAQWLGERGIECRHWVDIGPARAADASICEYAREHGFVLLTNDLDFPQILALTADTKPSVILLRGEPLLPEFRGLTLLKAISICRPDLDAGAILTIDWSDKIRARLLPLK